MSEERITTANIGSLVGKELGASSWIKIEQDRVNQFAECTGDKQWIHVDIERARLESPFGGTIAHGFLTLAMVAPTSFEVWGHRADVSAAINYGVDKCRFINPVKVGQSIRNRIKLVSVDDKGGGRMLLTTENTIEIEGEDKPALIASSLTMGFFR